MSAPSSDPGSQSASGRHIQQPSQAPDDRSKKNKTVLSQELIDALRRLPDPTMDVPPPMQYSNCWVAYRSSFVSIIKVMLPGALKSQTECSKEASMRYGRLTPSQKLAWKDYAELSKRMHDVNHNSRSAKRKRTAELAHTIAKGGFDNPFVLAPVQSSPVDTEAQVAEQFAARVPSSGRAPRPRPSRESRASPLGSESRSGSARSELREHAPPAPLCIPPASLHAPSPLSAVSQQLNWDPRVDPALAFVSESDSTSGSTRHSPSTPATQLHATMHWPNAQPASASPVQMQESAQNFIYPVGGPSGWLRASPTGEVQYPSALPSDARYVHLLPLSDRTTGEGYGLEYPQPQLQEHNPAAPPSGPSHESKDYDYDRDYTPYSHMQQSASQLMLHMTVDSPIAWSYASSPDTSTLPLGISLSDTSQFVSQTEYAAFMPTADLGGSFPIDYTAFAQTQAFYAPNNNGYQ